MNFKLIHSCTFILLCTQINYKGFKKTLALQHLFIDFDNPIYCCQMIKNIFSANTSLMEEHFIISNFHNHQHYCNIM